MCLYGLVDGTEILAMRFASVEEFHDMQIRAHDATDGNLYWWPIALADVPALARLLLREGLWRLHI